MPTLCITGKLEWPFMSLTVHRFCEKNQVLVNEKLGNRFQSLAYSEQFQANI